MSVQEIVRKSKTVEERFWLKVAKSECCWEWTAALVEGYGRLFVGRDAAGAAVSVGAHRISWERHFGAIPDGLFVCHHCDNRKCVRPDHLFLGTAADNTTDMLGKGRYVHPDLLRGRRWPQRDYKAGRTDGSVKITSHHVMLIRHLGECGVPQVGIAARLGVTSSHISRVINRKVWANI